MVTLGWVSPPPPACFRETYVHLSNFKQDFDVTWAFFVSFYFRRLFIVLPLVGGGCDPGLHGCLSGVPPPSCISTLFWTNSFSLTFLIMNLWVETFLRSSIVNMSLFSFSSTNQLWPYLASVVKLDWAHLGRWGVCVSIDKRVYVHMWLLFWLERTF